MALFRHQGDRPGQGETGLLHPVRSLHPSPAGLEPWDPFTLFKRENRLGLLWTSHCLPGTSKWPRVGSGEHLQPPETLRDYPYLVQATIIAHLAGRQDLLTALPILSRVIFVKGRSNHVTSHHSFSTHCSLDKIPVMPDLLPRLTLSPFIYSSTTMNSFWSSEHTMSSPTLESERILLLLPLLTYPWMLVIPGYCCISESSKTPEVGIDIFHVPTASLSNSLVLNRLCINTCLKIQTTLKNVE